MPRAFYVLFCEKKEGTIIASDSRLRGDMMLNIYFGDMPKDTIVFVDEGSAFVSSLDFARAIQKTDNYYVLVTREDLCTLPYSVNAILELKKTTSRFKRTYNKAYPIYDSLSASNVQLGNVEKLLTEDANSGYQLFAKIGERYSIACIAAAGKDNIKQKILPLKSEKILIIADGAAFGRR